jgi:hypothetical protein
MNLEKLQSDQSDSDNNMNSLSVFVLINELIKKLKSDWTCSAKEIYEIGVQLQWDI